VEYLTIIVICFFCGDLSVASVSLIGIRYTETVSELQQHLASFSVTYLATSLNLNLAKFSVTERTAGLSESRELL